MSTVAAPPAPVSAPEAPVQKSAEEQAKLSAFFDKMTGTTVEAATKAAKGVREVEGRMVEALIPKESTPVTEPPAAAPKPPQEPAAAPEAPETPPVAETPPEPKPKRKVPPKPTQQQDDDRLVRVATAAATAAVTASQPKPAPAPAAPKLEMEPDEEDQFAALQELERIQPERKGVADAYASGIKARADYEREWKKQNPNQQFDDNAAEHADFFEAQESKLKHTDADVKRGERALLKREVQESVAKERGEQETNLERKVRLMEEKENLGATATAAESLVLAALEIPKLEDTDEVDRPVYEGALRHANGFAQTAYKLVHGLEAHNPANPAHAEVDRIRDTLLDYFGSRAPEDTVNKDGKTYASPEAWGSLTPAQQRQHWTLTADDLIEYQASQIADRVKKIIASEQEKFEARAKKLGLTIEKPTKKQPPAAAPSTPAPWPQQRKSNAPSMGSDVLTTAPKINGGEPVAKGHRALAASWGL